MKILIDTNVILDALLENEDFSEDAFSILELSKESDKYEFVSSSAITDIFYICRKHYGSSQKAQDCIRLLVEYIHILSVTEDEILRALDYKWSDFEDAVQYSVALANNVDYIVTRNSKDYLGNRIPILTPKEFLAINK